MSYQITYRESVEIRAAEEEIKKAQACLVHFSRSLNERETIERGLQKAIADAQKELEDFRDVCERAPRQIAYYSDRVTGWRRVIDVIRHNHTTVALDLLGDIDRSEEIQLHLVMVRFVFLLRQADEVTPSMRQMMADVRAVLTEEEPDGA